MSSWQEQAACKNADPELFVGPSLDEPQTDLVLRVEYAVHYCDKCPVRRACREFGEANNFPGIWGGELFNIAGELKPTKRTRKGQPCGTESGYRRHVLNEKSEPCIDCVAAHEEAVAEGRGLKPCGTIAAYRRHSRYGEPPCSACQRAHADDVRLRQAKHRRDRKRDYAAERRARHERARFAASSAA